MRRTSGGGEGAAGDARGRKAAGLMTGDGGSVARTAAAATGAGAAGAASSNGAVSQQPWLAARTPVGGAQQSCSDACAAGCGWHGQLGSAATRANAARTAAADRTIPDIGLNGTTPRARRSSERPHSFTPRRRSAFEITVTELRLMAAAAIMGESSQPSQG
jgi:hypothetical protein